MLSLRILFLSFLLIPGLPDAAPSRPAEIAHPFYVSVFELRENAKEKILEMTCKIFTDDFEKDLRKSYNTHVDLLNNAGKPAMGKLINDYIKAHLQVSVDGKECVLEFIGFEQDEEAVDCYFQASNITVNKTVAIIDRILFDNRPEQVNIVHVMAKGVRKSIQLINPDCKVSFDFP